MGVAQREAAPWLQAQPSHFTGASAAQAKVDEETLVCH
jgi:hypothetical protein